MTTPLKELQQYCLRHLVPFVSYALPGERIPVSLFSQESEIRVFKSILEIDCNSGFILSPFQLESCPVIVIPDNIKETGWEISLKELPKPSDKSDNRTYSTNGLDQVLFPKYRLQIERIKRSLALGEAKKVVFLCS